MIALSARLREYARTFLRYLESGIAAALFDFGSYFVLLHLGVWYVTANIVGNALGFVSAFLFHKYISFQRSGSMLNHFVRYCVLNVVNIVAQTALLWIFVELLGIDASSAKVASWGVTVLGNFFLYKFFVYV